FIRVTGEGAFALCDGVAWGKRDHAGIGFDDQAGIAFLLTRNDVVDDHWTGGGNRFLDGRATGFADEQMAFVEHPREFIGPPNDPYWTTICRPFDCRPEFISAADRHRKID